MCVSVVAAWPWLKPSITATLRLVDSPWPIGGEGPWIKSGRKRECMSEREIEKYMYALM